jgi:hypothetical protein
MHEDVKYWVVGANWEGDDQAEAFFKRGYWVLGWSDKDQPGKAAQRQKMKPGDRIAVKSMRGQGASTITIKGLGIIKEVGEDKRVYVDWFLKNMEREVPSHGCLASIHGPYSVKADQAWLGQVFRI